MKNQLLTISIFLCGIVASSGQQQTNPQSILTNEITELCDLSPEQVAKVQPIVANFEQKRDYTYRKFHHTPAVLTKEVKQNKWNYEFSLIGILTPEQMGLLKAFDQRNADLMSGSGTRVTKVDYLVSRDNISTQTASVTTSPAATSSAPVALITPTVAMVPVSTEEVTTSTPEIVATVQPATQPTVEPVASTETPTQYTYQSVLIDQMKELCDLTPEQLTKVQPIVATFELKRDKSYRMYHHYPTVFTREVKQNRWNYEVSLIGILSPEQMGLLKAFDQRNTELMSGTGTNVISVDYLLARTK